MGFDGDIFIEMRIVVFRDWGRMNGELVFNRIELGFSGTKSFWGKWCECI